MAICPACAETVPDGVDACPHCGIKLLEDAVKQVGKSGRGHKTTLLSRYLVAAGLFGILAICGGMGIALYLPMSQGVRELAQELKCRDNLKQIGLALHNYHTAYGAFPPAYLADKNGHAIHSWRVLILPFLGEQALIQEYSFSEPWDGPNNSLLLTKMPAVYTCPGVRDATDKTLTAYAGIFGEHCVFRGAKAISIGEITDGVSKTLIVGEMVPRIPWTKPEDVDIAANPRLGGDGFGFNHVAAVNFLTCDGSIRVFAGAKDHPPLETLRALFTCDGDDDPGNF